MMDGTEQNGGVYHKELTKLKCTHLVAVSADGDKYQHAIKWRNIKIVSPAWFEKSIAAKRAPCKLLCSLCSRSRGRLRSVSRRGPVPSQRRGGSRRWRRCRRATAIRQVRVSAAVCSASSFPEVLASQSGGCSLYG